MAKMTPEEIETADDLQQATLRLMGPLYQFGDWRIMQGVTGYVRFRLEKDGGLKFDSDTDNEKLTGQINKRGFVIQRDLYAGHTRVSDCRDWEEYRSICEVFPPEHICRARPEPERKK